MSRNISVESAKTYFGCLNYFSDIRIIVRARELLTLKHVRNMIETSRVHRLDRTDTQKKRRKTCYLS